MANRGLKRCRRCAQFFPPVDLYTGCRLCGTCYRRSVESTRVALANLLAERREGDSWVRQLSHVDLTSEELGIVVTAIDEFVKVREKQGVHKQSIYLAFSAMHKLSALAPGFTVKV